MIGLLVSMCWEVCIVGAISVCKDVELYFPGLFVWVNECILVEIHLSWCWFHRFLGLKICVFHEIHVFHAL